MNVQIIWDLEDDPDGNAQHIADHGITIDEVEDVLLDPQSTRAVSRSSGMPLTFGYTAVGRYLAVVWELVSDDPPIIRPVTAYDAPEPRKDK
jgi:uncharacterized DUF497 family protein